MLPDLSLLKLDTPAVTGTRDNKRPSEGEEPQPQRHRSYESAENGPSDVDMDGEDADSQATEVDPEPLAAEVDPDSQATEVDSPEDEYLYRVHVLLRRVDANAGVRDASVLGPLLRECRRLLEELDTHADSLKVQEARYRLEDQISILDDLLSGAIGDSQMDEGPPEQLADRVAVQPPTQDNPARRTRRAEQQEAQLRDALQKASRAIADFESPDRRGTIEAALASLQRFSEGRAASMRVILQAELARLAVLRGDDQAGALREDALQRELEEARLERERRVRTGEEDGARSGEETEEDEPEEYEPGESSLPEGEYRAKALLDRLATKKGVQYFVEWDGFPVGTDAWQPEMWISEDLKQAFEGEHGPLVDDDIQRVIRLLPPEHVLVEARQGRNARLKQSDLLHNAAAMVGAFKQEQRDRQRQQGLVGRSRAAEVRPQRAAADDGVQKLLVWDARGAILTPPAGQ